MKPLFYAAALLVMASCTTASPLKPVARLYADASFEETIELMLTQTQKCWATSVNPLKDGIHLARKASPNTATILGWRRSWGGGGSLEPFVALQINRLNSGAIIDVSEGEFARSIAGGTTLNVAADIPRWLQGDLDCKPFEHSLWHF